ncbi:MAG: helix-turn-helix transcriptional regulator [Candidatus Hydrogenedentes bacterium]|nr:helix-turn-helix transcriptional regulator [Candidatus Hydrogenedentota bacterium]
MAGNWMLKELRYHGYDISPDTLYPRLKRMAEHERLACQTQGNSVRARKSYRITRLGTEGPISFVHKWPNWPTKSNWRARR